ncbi:hypothetical protein ACUY3U_14435 [Gordonia amicalis]
MTEVGGRLAEIASDTAPSFDAFLTRQPGFLAHFAEKKSEFEYLGANVPLLLKGMCGSPGIVEDSSMRLRAR